MILETQDRDVLCSGDLSSVDTAHRKPHAKFRVIFGLVVLLAASALGSRAVLDHREDNRIDGERRLVASSCGVAIDRVARAPRDSPQGHVYEVDLRGLAALSQQGRATVHYDNVYCRLALGTGGRTT